MQVISVPDSKGQPGIDKNGVSVDSKQPKMGLLERQIHRFSVNEGNSSFLEQVASNSRVLIIEGISGSGKDTFQKYLKSRLRNRVVHAYSEGEMLWSWKHQQIKDIFKLQIRLMRNFLDHIAATLEHDETALFILNRFHLSTHTMYSARIAAQPTISREYDLLVEGLRALPTHVFLLQLMESEMEVRSSHPERGIAWRKFQQHIFQREGFGNFVKRNMSLQKAMINAAIRQRIPFSIFRLPSTARRLESTQILTEFDAAFTPLVQKLDLPRNTAQAV